MKTPLTILGLLAIASLGGALFSLLHVPLAWMLGALLASAGLVLAFPHLTLPIRLRMIGQLIVGSGVGLGFTATVLAHLVGLSPAMVAATAATMALAIALSFVLARVARVDAVSAYYASMPGGVAEMVTLAERYGGVPALVSLSQTLRIFLTVVTIPFIVSFLATAHPVAVAQTGPADWLPLAAVLGLSLVAGVAIETLRIPNAWLLGGILVGGIAANLEIGPRAVPHELVVVAQILIGSSLGIRFRREILLRLHGFLAATVAMTLLVIAVTVVLALLFTQVFDVDLVTLILALAPGGIAEMSITALAMGANVPVVTGFHLVRIVSVALFSVPLFKLLDRRRG